MLYDPKWKAPEVKLEPWQQLMLKGADLIEEQGWVKRTYHVPDKGYCVMGAMRSFTDLADPPKSEFRLEDYCKAVHKLRDSLFITCSVGTCSVGTWNDYVATNKEQVIAKLREVAGAK